MTDQVRLAYIAGIIDGEGTVGHFGNGRGTNKRFLVEVNMTCKPIIDLLQETFGGSVVMRPRQQPHWQDQWRWRVVSAEARAVYRQLEPFLILKKNRLEDA